MTRVRAVSTVQGFRALYCKWLGSRLPGVSVLRLAARVHVWGRRVLSLGHPTETETETASSAPETHILKALLYENPKPKP